MLLDSPSRSVHDQYEDEDHWLRARRRHRVLSALFVVLVLILGAAGWYAYPILKRNISSVAQLAGTQQSLDKINGNLQQQQSTLSEWSNDRQEIRDEVTRLGQGMQSRFEAMRKETGRAAENLFHTAQAQFERQLEAVRSRITALESSRAADQARIATLQEQLGQVRSELSEQTSQLNAVRSQMESRDAATETRLVSLQDSAQRNRQRVDAIDNRLAMNRIDFEVAKGHSRELAPGISLGITGTDVAFRRVTGWMWVLPDRRTVWLRQQGAQEPVEFYSYTDGKKRELVITNVAKGAVAGYLLIPKEAAAPESAASPSPSTSSE